MKNNKPQASGMKSKKAASIPQVKSNKAAMSKHASILGKLGGRPRGS